MNRFLTGYIVYRAGYENAKIWIENAIEGPDRKCQKIYYENAKKILL
jgi:hypothetical protein